MTRKEAICELQSCVDAWDKWTLPGCSLLDKYKEAVKMALAALRGPTREQVKKCFGSMWEFDDEDFDYDWHCGKCECPTNVRPNFCPRCGSPMTDEAVDIVMKRLEKLYEDR